MLGTIIDYEGKRIWNEGFNEGYKKGFDEGQNKELELIAMNLLREKMEIPFVVKYTNLPHERVQELAKKLEM